MPTEEVNESTRGEWRELGFFYERDDEARAWRIVGTASGLKRFAQLLRMYARNPGRASLSEHEHYGPYMYLEIGTWSVPQITDHWIAGSQADLDLLATAVEEELTHMVEGRAASLGARFAPASAYDLVIELRGEPFDPAREDENCW